MPQRQTQFQAWRTNYDSRSYDEIDAENELQTRLFREECAFEADNA